MKRLMIVVVAVTALAMTGATFADAASANKTSRTTVTKSKATGNPSCPYGFAACLRRVTRGGGNVAGSAKFCSDRCN